MSRLRAENIRSDVADVTGTILSSWGLRPPPPLPPYCAADERHFSSTYIFPNCDALMWMFIGKGARLEYGWPGFVVWVRPRFAISFLFNTNFLNNRSKNGSDRFRMENLHLQSIRLKTSDRACIKFGVEDNIYYGQCKILVF